MATGNQSPFRIRSIIPLPSVPTACAGEGQAEERALAGAEPVTEEMLRARGYHEWHTWRPTEPGGSHKALEDRWKATSNSIHATTQKLLQVTATGVVLSGDARLFLDHASLFRIALQGSHEAIRIVPRLPHVERLEDRLAPRAYAAVESYLRTVDYEFDERTFSVFMPALQKGSPLKTEEVWSLKPFLQFALLERIARRTESLDTAGATESLGLARLVASVERIGDIDWKEMFEAVSLTDLALREDPAGAYARMDFESRENYRKAVAEMAAHSIWTETAIARKAVDLARAAQNASHRDARMLERRSHVGYYLIDEGAYTLKRAIDYEAPLSARVREPFLRWPGIFYFIGIEAVTIAAILVLLEFSGTQVSGLLALFLFLLPAAECAVAIMNQLATTLVSPKNLPKLDFSKGIPAGCTAMVVVPTLLISEAQVTRAVDDMEIRYLANRDPNLHFAILSDLPDSLQEVDEKDALVDVCVNAIERLNRKYASEGKGSFFLFHRRRVFNASEGTWMGWERKRGKLLDFNRLLRGEYDSFPVKVGDLSVLPAIKYVVTVDLDTQLPRDSARKLVGALAHPLQRAVIDPATNTVVEGYGILQPRVGISVQSAGRSRLASIFSGDTGFDIYTRAVSDVYQDLFQEGTYTGKGIYDVEVFDTVLKHRFPCNALLSHDMLEGAYVRTGFLSDVEVIDDYPSHLSAFSRRKHRWVRGDWQIIFWLFRRVPDYFGQMVPNPVNIVSRWKIVDNLRRSLTEFATFVLFLCGWFVLPGKAFYWTVATVALLVTPIYFQFLLSLLRSGRHAFSAAFWKNAILDMATAHANVFFRLTFLCHQSLVTLDAVVRTIIRVTLTHRRLLEWETAAEAESTQGVQSPVEGYLEWAPLIALILAIVLVAVRPEALAAAAPILFLWGSSKIICEWLNEPRRAGGTKITARQSSLVRLAALRTWRFFHEFSNADENWLVPDIVQETPARTAHHISPTNLGFLLNSRLAAYDLGYLTLGEFVTETESTFESVGRMPKSRGHLYNWYDTRTLEPLRPLFISTVDNGNLVCCLWELKNGCLEIANQPLFRPALWDGIVDHVEILEELLERDGGEDSLQKELSDLHRRVASLADPQCGWLEAVPALDGEVAATVAKLPVGEVSEEARWWARELSERMARLSRMVRDFAPWLLPDFAKYREISAIRKTFPLADLTPESAPKLLAGLAEGLRAAIEKAGNYDRGSAVHALCAALASCAIRFRSLASRLERLAGKADALAKEMDFGIFYNAQKKQISIGFDGEKDCVSQYHYDLLASEARAAVFVGIAKNEIPQECWFQLERSHVVYKGVHVLLSWTGTMFEYLMPALWMRLYPNTILEYSARGAVRAQQKFVRRKAIPWGISESSCNERNPDGFYRYFAFGVPALALNRDAGGDVVISPYSSFLALLIDAASATKNLQKMKQMGWLGAYGFYEAADFTASRVNRGNQCEVVRCWMAHHQGMSLVAAANILCDASSQRRFHADAAVAATERLLHEKARSGILLESRDEAGAEESAPAGLLQRLLSRPDHWGAAPSELKAGAGPQATE